MISNLLVTVDRINIDYTYFYKNLFNSMLT